MGEDGEVINRIEFKEPVNFSNNDKMIIYYKNFKVVRITKNGKNIKFKTIK